jgi:peroxiredoxin Q/BCP
MAAKPIAASGGADTRVEGSSPASIGVRHMLTEGTTAPAFTVPNHDGVEVALSDYDGKWVLLWWYPKADTPG